MKNIYADVDVHSDLSPEDLLRLTDGLNQIKGFVFTIKSMVTVNTLEKR